LELDVVVEVVPVVVVEVVPDVVVAVVAVVAVPEVSLIVLADVEVEVVELVSVAIVPLVEVSVAVDIVEDVSVAAALESVLLAAVSLLQAKPNTLRARTVRRTRSFLLMLFFPLVVGWLWVCPGIEFVEKSARSPPLAMRQNLREARRFATWSKSEFYTIRNVDASRAARTIRKMKN
jgi:hypothetical protein